MKKIQSKMKVLECSHYEMGIFPDSRAAYRSEDTGVFTTFLKL